MIDLRGVDWKCNTRYGSTGGQFYKAREGSKYYKLSQYQESMGIFGFESVLEVIVSNFCELLNIPHIVYSGFEAFVSIHGREGCAYVCSSEDFNVDGYSKVTYSFLCKLYGLPIDDAYTNFKKLGMSKEFYEFNLLDFLIINRDRHNANIEFLVGEGNNDLRLIPSFDLGCSLIAPYFDRISMVLGLDVLGDYPVNSCLVEDRSLYTGLKYLKSCPNCYKPTVKGIYSREELNCLFDNVMLRYLPPSDLSEEEKGIYQLKIIDILWERYNYAKREGIFNTK